MKKMNGCKVAIDSEKIVGPPQKPTPDRKTPAAAHKGTFPPRSAMPLRAAKGDDDLMSQEPTEPRHG